MATFKFFRDSLQLDENLLDRLTKAGLTPKPADTLGLGARLCTITAHAGDFNYLISADKLSVTTPLPLTISGTSGKQS